MKSKEMKNKIIERLSHLGKSQSWLSKRTVELFPEHPIPRDRLSRIISGKLPNPTIRTALMLATALGCLVEDLFILGGGKNDRPKKS